MSVSPKLGLINKHRAISNDNILFHALNLIAGHKNKINPTLVAMVKLMSRIFHHYPKNSTTFFFYFSPRNFFPHFIHLFHLHNN